MSDKKHNSSDWQIKGKLQQQIATLQAENERLINRLGDQHSEIVSLAAEKERLEREKGLLVALYERHKHLDVFLSDESLPPIGRTGSAILYELWKFIKEAAIDGGALE